MLGGVSLGTNVGLLATVQAPERVRGLVLEMPVLESAVPAAALTFVPFLLQAHYGRPVMRLVSRAASRLPRSGLGSLDSLIDAASSDPDEIAAVLHGVLVGPIAPTIDQRRAITAPALVPGHGIDLIHSFRDAQRLARQLPDARLIRTRTFAELWVRPAPADGRDQRVPRPRMDGRRTAGPGHGSGSGLTRPSPAANAPWPLPAVQLRRARCRGPARPGPGWPRSRR
ncbi:MAG TPA: hypothetical protein VFW50_35945 [Streptosporangiaceae bacterium]|nr:hypothetical protein [Streptosporangiaceae bacterium]